MGNFNYHLGARIFEQIMDQPDTHYQGAWASECGTVRCVAGWAVRFAMADAGFTGSMPTRLQEDQFIRDLIEESRDRLVTELGHQAGYVDRRIRYSDPDYELAGSALLDLNQEGVSRLFYSDEETAVDRLGDMIVEGYESDDAS